MHPVGIAVLLTVYCCTEAVMGEQCLSYLKYYCCVTNKLVGVTNK